MPKSEAIAITPDQAKALAERLIVCIQTADTDQAGRNDLIETGRAMFVPRPARANLPWEDAAQMAVPVCEVSLNQWVSLLDTSLFCVQPLFRLQGGDKVAASDTESFLEKFISPWWRSTVLPAVEAGFRDGSACLYITWRQEQGTRTRWQTYEQQVEAGTQYFAVDPSTGSPVEVSPEDAAELETMLPGSVQQQPLYSTEIVREGVVENCLVQDGPHFLVLETGFVPATDGSHAKARWGTYPAAGADIQGSTLVFFRYSLTGEEINARVAAGEFDPDAVDQIRTNSSNTNQMTVADQQQEVANSADASGTWQWKKFDLIEGYCRVPPVPKDHESEKAEKRREAAAPVDMLFTLAEGGNTLVRCIPNPWWHGKRPFQLIRPFRATSGVHGSSLPDLAGDIQDTIREAVWQMFDMAQKRTRPPKKVKKGLLASYDREDLDAQDRPGGLYEVDYPDAITVMAEGLGDSTALMPMIEMAHDWWQRVSGTTDNGSGLVNGPGTTAMEARIADARVDALYRHVRQNISEDLKGAAEFVLALCYQFIGNESVQRVWGQANPEYGQRQQQDGAGEPQGQQYLPGERELTPEQGFSVAAWGVAESSNRAVNQANQLETYPLVRDLPQQSIPLELLAQLPDEQVQQVAKLQYSNQRDLVNSRGAGDTEEKIGTEENYVQLVMAMVGVLRQRVQEQQQAQQMAQQGQAQAAQASAQGKSALADQGHQNRLEQIALAGQMRQGIPPQGMEPMPGGAP